MKSERDGNSPRALTFDDTARMTKVHPPQAKLAPAKGAR